MRKARETLASRENNFPETIMSKMLFAGAALALLSSASTQAAPPILAGDYSLVVRSWCQGHVTAHFNASNLVDSLDYDGGATTTVFGTANFDPDTGKVKLEGFSHNGSPFLLALTGNQNTTEGIPLAEQPFSAKAKYKTAKTSLKLGDATYHAIYSQPDQNGIAHNVTLLILTTDVITCSAQGEATRQ
jgi:hypothetical protein